MTTHRRAVCALGGNAFERPSERISIAGQRRFAREAIASLAPLLRSHCDLLVAHGNGPQVGHVLRRSETTTDSYALPLDVCVAHSQGELGYILVEALRDVLGTLGDARPVAALLTSVEVSPDDRAFNHPEKPIGDDRRLVPSPRPRGVVELDVIRKVIDASAVVVAGGGGGIPLVRRGQELRGVAAVVDKDLTAAMIADAIDADLLLILTNVPCAFTDFGTARERPIGRVTPEQARTLREEGHFGKGSMEPKIDAAIEFASKPGRRAIICDHVSVAAALALGAGTIVELAGGAS